MSIERITSLDHPGVEVYSALTETQLRNRLQPDKGVFIAESPKVIRVALDAGYEPLSMLCEERHIVGDAADIIARCGNIPVFTGERTLLAQLTGYTLTRGVLCAMRRKPMGRVAEVCGNATRVCVIDGVTDTTNIGAIFRSAAALGFDAVVLAKTPAIHLIAVPCVCLWARCFLCRGRGQNNLWLNFLLWDFARQQWH